MNDVLKTRFKLALVFLISNILLFYKEAFFLNGIIFLFTICYIFFIKKLTVYFSWLKVLFFVTGIIFVIQLLTKESLVISILSSLRILSLSSLVFLFIHTTQLSLIIKALDFFPPQITYVLGLSLGMIPQLTKEAKIITIAQQARGHKMNWNIFKSYLPILLPLFTKSFIRSEQISISIQARGFKLSK